MCNYVIASTFLVFFSYKRKEWRRCWCRRRRHCERREYKKGRWKNEIKWNVEKKKKTNEGAARVLSLSYWNGEEVFEHPSWGCISSSSSWIIFHFFFSPTPTFPRWDPGRCLLGTNEPDHAPFHTKWWRIEATLFARCTRSFVECFFIFLFCKEKKIILKTTKESNKYKWKSSAWNSSGITPFTFGGSARLLFLSFVYIQAGVCCALCIHIYLHLVSGLPKTIEKSLLFDDRYF